MNENGGCDLHPKPTIIEHGDLPGDFTAEQKENLIYVSLKEIQSACRNQSSIDWRRFAERMNKMEMFLKDFKFDRPKSLYFASSYIVAMRLLYSNGQGDPWFSKGEEFVKRIENGIIDKDQGASEALSSQVYTHYAVLLGARFDKTKDKTDGDAVIGPSDKAISLDPKNGFAYEFRGSLYSHKGKWDRAIEDYSKAIGLDQKDAFAYGNRGLAYLNKGEWDRAIEDYTKAIGLDPNPARYGARGEAHGEKGDWDRAIEDFTKAIELDPKVAGAYTARGYAYSEKSEWDHAIEDYTKAIDFSPKDAKSAALWNSRCWARAIAGQLQQALPDCNQSLDLKPNDANTRDSRAFVYLKMDKVEDAIADYNIALGLNPSLAASLYGRGVAKLRKEDIASGNSDIESAKKIQPDIAEKFQRYGVQVKQLSQSPPGSRTGRGHRSRQPADR